jgi:hypothetical protein
MTEENPTLTHISQSLIKGLNLECPVHAEEAVTTRSYVRFVGRAVAQEVGRWLRNAAAWV